MHLYKMSSEDMRGKIYCQIFPKIFLWVSNEVTNGKNIYCHNFLKIHLMGTK